MIKLLLLALLLLLSNFGQAQTTGPGFVIYVGSAPSGTCSAGAYQEDVIGLGTVYTCQSGTWTQVSGGGGSGVTSVATTTPITGGTITGTGTIACATCVKATSPGAGIAHFAGSTQEVTSSLIVAADITSGTITGTQISSSAALPNGVTATTQSASDNSTKVATTAYVDAKSTGALVKLCTLTASTSASLDFVAANCTTNPFSSTYDEYLISVKNLVPSVTGSALQMRVSTNGTSCDSGSSPGYASNNFFWYSGGTGNVAGSGNTGLNAMFVGDDHTSSTASNGGLSSSLHFFTPASTTNNKQMTGTTFNFNNAVPAPVGTTVLGAYNSTTAVLGFCFTYTSANITSGSATVYGIVK